MQCGEVWKCIGECCANRKSGRRVYSIELCFDMGETWRMVINGWLLIGSGLEMVMVILEKERLSIR